MAINKKLITFSRKDIFLGANGINGATSANSSGFWGNIPSYSIVFIKDTCEIWHNGKYFSGIEPYVTAYNNATRGFLFRDSNGNYTYKSVNLWGNTFDGSGDVNGKITRNSGGSWISGRDNVVVELSRTSSEGSDWHPIIGVKTTSGYWSMGSVGGESLCLSYDTDTDYNNSNNSAAVINFPAAGRSGTLALTSDNVASADYASSAPWTGISSIMQGGNEFNIPDNDYPYNSFWINYLPRNVRSGNSVAITDYYFGNLAAGLAYTNAAGYKKDGSNDNYVLLGGGGHKLESSLSVSMLRMNRIDGINNNNYDSILRAYLLNLGNGYNSNQGWLLDFAWDWNGHYTTQLGLGLNGSWLAHRGDNGDGTYSAWNRIYDDVYHPSADTSEYPAGFSGRQLSNWSGTGLSKITGWHDGNGGDILFLTNGSGLISVEVDGFFYQGIDTRGEHRVLDEYDAAYGTWVNATYAANMGSASDYVTYAQVKALHNWYTTAAGSDTQGVIDNWNEIKNFIDGFHETDDLATYLVNTFVAKSGSTMTGTLTITYYGPTIHNYVNKNWAFQRYTAYDSDGVYSDNMYDIGTYYTRDTFEIRRNGGDNWAFSPNTLFGYANNTYYLGTSSYRWANIYSTLGDFSGTVTVKSLAISSEASDYGIAFPGGAWINSIRTEVIFRNSTIRFGGSSWDWDVWAGLNYDSTTQTINIGVPNSSHWTVNSDHTSGTIRTVSSKIEIYPNGNTNWGEGLRIHSASNGWTTLMLAGTDNTGFNGTSSRSWSLHTYGGDFHLTKGGSDGLGYATLKNIGGNWYLNCNTTSNTVLETFNVNGSGRFGTTATGSIFIKPERMTTSGGAPYYFRYGNGLRGTMIYSNGIAFADPYQADTSNNDYAWIRHLETTGNSGSLEIAVGDDSNELIYLRGYNTSNTIQWESYFSGGKLYGQGYYHTSYGSSNYVLTSDGGVRHENTWQRAVYTINRDFINGTLIYTDIDYSVTNGDPFYLEIKGNVYSRGYSCFTQAQGYIYADTIINYGVTHLGVCPIDGLIAMNVDGALCFWFPRQSYWEGYSIAVYSAYDYRVNRVTNVTDSADPGGTKRVNLSANTCYNLNNSNFTSTIDGTYLKYEGWWGGSKNVNDASGMVFCYAAQGAPGPNWGTLSTFEYARSSGYKMLLFSDGYSDGHTYYRNKSDDRGGWGNWIKFLDTANSYISNGLGYLNGTVISYLPDWYRETYKSKDSDNNEIESVTGWRTDNFIKIMKFCPPSMYRTTGDQPAPYGIGFGNGSESGGIMPVGSGDYLQEIRFYGANSGPTIFTFGKQVWEGSSYDNEYSNAYAIYTSIDGSNGYINTSGRYTLNGYAGTYHTANNIAGYAGEIWFGGNFHIDSQNGLSLYLNYFTSESISLAQGGGNVGIGQLGGTHKLNVVGNIDSYNFKMYGSSLGGSNCNDVTNTGLYYYTSNGPSGLGEQSTDGALYSQAYSTLLVAQIALDYRNGNLFVRSKNGGTWLNWNKIIARREGNGVYFDLGGLYAHCKYYVIRIPNASTIWHMLSMDITMRSYPNYECLNLQISAGHGGNDQYYGATACVISTNQDGYFTNNMHVYLYNDGEYDYVYIGNSEVTSNYSTLCINNMLQGDSAAYNDCSQITINTADSVPNGATKCSNVTLAQYAGTFVLQGTNTWFPNDTNKYKLQLGRNDSSSYSWATVGVTDGNLHIDSYRGHAIYLNYYNPGTIYFGQSGYYISSGGSYYNGTAAYAYSPYGFSFSDRSSNDWSGVSGTFITDWSHSSGADIMFKYNGGALNVITDGYFYQGIDYKGASYRVLDEYDITHTQWGTAGRSDYTGRDSFIQSPVGGTFVTSASTYTGYLRIKMPCALINTMLSFFVDIYDYNMNRSVTYKISGYSYEGGWVNTTAQCVSSYEGSLADLSVRFGTLDGKAAIEIGESDTSWSYPQVVVRDFLYGYNNYTLASYFDSWVIDFSTTSITVSTYDGDYSHSYHANVGLKAKDAATVGGYSPGNFLRYEGYWDSTHGSTGVDSQYGMNFVYSGDGAPFSWGVMVTFEPQRGSGYRLQLGSNGYSNSGLWYRNRSSNRGGWTDWVNVWDDTSVRDGLIAYSQDRNTSRNTDSTCLPNGFYWCGAGTMPANVGDIDIITVNANSNYGHQLGFKFSGSGTTGSFYDGKDLYTRIYNNGSWLPWYTIYTSGNTGWNYDSTVRYEPHTKAFYCTKNYNGWDNQFYSTDGYVTDVEISFKIGLSGTPIMVGLNSDPSANASYDSIDYCWYIDGGGAYIYESSSSIGSYGTCYAGDEFSVSYSGGFIRYYWNGVLYRTVARSISGKLYADASFFNSGYVYDVWFGKKSHESVGENNNAIDALLHSGYGRGDNAAGSTWLFIDDAGGYSSPWGIRHDLPSNLIEYYGGGSRVAYTDLSSGILYNLGLCVINDSSNNSYDSLAYFRHYSNNDWGLVVDKTDSYTYGVDIRVGGDLALRVGSGNTHLSGALTVGADATPSYTLDVRGNARFTGATTTEGLASFANINNSTYNYDGAAVWIREYGYGGAQSDTWGNAPRLGWHWSGRVAAQIGLASNGWLYEAPETGTNFYKLVVENSGTWGINISGSAGSAGYIVGPDNRSTNNTPSWYMTNLGAATVYSEFCMAGGAVSGAYENRVTFTPWGDQRPVLMAFNGYGAFLRTSYDDSTWNNWETIWTSHHIEINNSDGRNANNVTYNAITYYTSNGPTNLGEQSTDGALFTLAYSSNWVALIAQDYRDGRLYIRSKNNGTWKKWYTVALSGEEFDLRNNVTFNPITLLFYFDGGGYITSKKYYRNCIVKFKAPTDTPFIRILLTNTPGTTNPIGGFKFVKNSTTAYAQTINTDSVPFTYATTDYFSLEAINGKLYFYLNSTLIHSCTYTQDNFKVYIYGNGSDAFTLPEVLVYPLPITTQSLNNLSNVSISNPVGGLILKCNGTNWINGDLSLSDLTDTLISLRREGDVLTYNPNYGWVNAAGQHIVSSGSWYTIPYPNSHVPNYLNYDSLNNTLTFINGGMLTSVNTYKSAELLFKVDRIDQAENATEIYFSYTQDIEQLGVALYRNNRIDVINNGLRVYLLNITTADLITISFTPTTMVIKVNNSIIYTGSAPLAEYRRLYISTVRIVFSNFILTDYTVDGVGLATPWADSGGNGSAGTSIPTISLNNTKIAAQGDVKNIPDYMYFPGQSRYVALPVVMDESGKLFVAVPIKVGEMASGDKWNKVTLKV